MTETTVVVTAPTAACTARDGAGARPVVGGLTRSPYGPAEPRTCRAAAGRYHRRVTFDVARVRALYPALADGFAWLDGAAGTQVPRSVIDAISDAYRAGLGNLG